jgi:hypothetical protein
MLIHIYNHPTTAAAHLTSGDIALLRGTALPLNQNQLKAAIEVLNAVIDGDLDECCWVGGFETVSGTVIDTDPTPNVYEGMPSFSGSSLISATNHGNSYIKSNGVTNTYYAGSVLKEDYRAMGDLIDELFVALPTNPYSASYTSPQKMQWAEYELLKNLKPLWGKLFWGFSYIDNTVFTDANLSNKFRQKYAFSCIICFGAGFYDTSKLHTKTTQSNGYPSYTANVHYTAIYNNFTSAVRTWMTNQANNQYPTNVNWNGKAPIQLSTGPTWQSSWSTTRGDQNHSAHIYPTHCHGSTELYKVLDPMEMIRVKGTTSALIAAIALLPYTTGSPDQWQYSYASHIGAATFVRDMYPEWLASHGGGILDSFRWTDVGTMFYNHERDYHALHNGKWVQLTQWARLTSPAEGTYFPLHDITLQKTHLPLQNIYRIADESPTGGCNG